MELTQPKIYSTSYAITIDIIYNQKTLQYVVKYVVMDKGFRYVEYIYKAHQEKLTTSEKKQIKALINEYVKATFK